MCIIFQIWQCTLVLLNLKVQKVLILINWIGHSTWTSTIQKFSRLLQKYVGKISDHLTIWNERNLYLQCIKEHLFTPTSQGQQTLRPLGVWFSLLMNLFFSTIEFMFLHHWILNLIRYTHAKFTRKYGVYLLRITYNARRLSELAIH